MNESSENPETAVEATVASNGQKRPIWQTPSVWVAATLMVLGLGFWVVQGLTGDKDETATSSSTPGASSLMESRSVSGEDTEAESGARSPVSPAVFRLGAGYLGGFFLGWAFRKFLTLTLLAAGGLVALMAVFQGLGWFEVNWAAVDEHLKVSLSWIHGQAGSFKTFVTGYLPSAGAASAGIFVGFRRR